MLQNKAEITANLRESIAEVSDVTVLEKERDKFKEETILYAERVENCIRENAQTAQNQQEYQQRYEALVDCYETAKSKFELLEKEIAERHTRVQAMEEFIANISKQNPLSGFDETLWGTLLESITVYSKKDMRVKFKD
jgi:chromosome segregation ATPase